MNERPIVAYPTLDAPGMYFREIWRYRNLWLSLALVDLRNRFRRSRVGVLWVIIHPFMFTLILGVIFTSVFNKPFVSLTLYIFSGIVLWNWIVEVTTLGSNSIIFSKAFILQKRLPLMGYVIRVFLMSLTTYLLALSGVFLWLLITRHLPGLWSLLLPFHIVLIAAALFPVAAFSAILGTMHRDYQQMVMVLLQALWFVSPVFMAKDVFLHPGLREWDMANPVSAMLELMRAPLLENRPPEIWDYLVVLVFALAAWALAYHLFKRHEQHIVYYL